MGKKTKYFTTKQEKEEIVDAISSFLQQHGEIYAAYLFGSFITKESFADIDLGVLLRREPEDILEYEIELESKLEKLERFRLDVRVLNRAPISFAQNVIRYGRLIIDREPNIRSDFESYVLKKYFDFARFRRIYLAEVINAPL
jgi:predicted nucleotidyltransferase